MRMTVLPASVGVLVASLLVGCTPGTQPAARERREPVVLSIVGTNDLHGAILSSSRGGGLAVFGGFVANLRAARARDRGGVVLIDAGDMWQGTMESNLTEGAVVVDAYNRLGYLAATIGNHEFDFGPVGDASTPTVPGDDPRGALKAGAAAAEFAVLAANIIDDATGRPVAWPNVSPSTTREVAGVTLGVIGVTTAGTLSASMAANTSGLSISPLVPSIVAEATRLRAAGAAVVVVAAHAGGSCRAVADPADASSCDPSAEIVRVARELPAGLVDVIVAGHTHAGMAHLFNGIAIVESYSRGQAFGRVDVLVDPETKAVVDRRIFPPQAVTADATYEGAPVRPDPLIADVLSRSTDRVRARKSESLGVVAATRLRINEGAESPLGNLFTDAMLAMSPGSDVAINNTDGGLRADLPAGPVTYGRVFEVFPFDNRLVAVRLEGARLRELFASYLQTTGQLLGVAGVRVEASCVGGEIDVRLIRPSGALVGDREVLQVVTTDFLATTPRFAPFVPAARIDTPPDAPLVRDLVVAWLRQRGGELRVADFVNPAAPRWPPRRRLPVRCGYP